MGATSLYTFRVRSFGLDPKYDRPVEQERAGIAQLQGEQLAETRSRAYSDLPRRGTTVS